MLTKSPTSQPAFSFRYDTIVVVCYLLLLVAGILSICGSTGSFDTSNIFTTGSRPLKQILWVGVSFGFIFALFFVDSYFFRSFATLFYLFVLLLLLATLVLAPDIKGSRSWLVIGPFSIQSAEFAKLSTALMLASVFDRYGFQLKGWRAYLEVFAIILVPAVIIVLQKETGTALVFAVFSVVLFREGLPGIYLACGAIAITLFVTLLYTADTLWSATRANYFLGSIIITISTLIFLYDRVQKRYRFHVKRLAVVVISIYTLIYIASFFVLFDWSYVAIALLVGVVGYIVVIMVMYFSRRYFYSFLFALFCSLFALSVSYVYEDVLKPHQQDRIAVALGIKEDFRGAGYNVNQAKIAIGSGGFWGKGFMKGTQTKLNYVPEQDTDFIFCTIGEEYGFVGSVFLLTIFLVMLLRLLFLAEQQQSTFARVYGYSVACIFLFHLTINVGMVLGLVPVVGIPLPFLSYGGSSLVTSTVMLFIFLRMDSSNRKRKEAN